MYTVSLFSMALLLLAATDLFCAHTDVLYVYVRPSVLSVIRKSSKDSHSSIKSTDLDTSILNEPELFQCINRKIKLSHCGRLVMPVVFSVAPLPGILCSSILIHFMTANTPKYPDLCYIGFQCSKNQHNRAAVKFCLRDPYIME